MPETDARSARTGRPDPIQPAGGTVRILAVAALAGAAAWLLCHYLVEPDYMEGLCTAAAAPAWCWLRQVVVLGFVFNVYGYLSLAAAVLAMLLRWSWLAWLALIVGVTGCVLYRFDPAGAGALLAALVIARLDAGRQQQGAAEQQA